MPPNDDGFFGGVFGAIGDGFETILDIRIDQEVDNIASSDDSVNASNTALPGGGTTSGFDLSNLPWPAISAVIGVAGLLIALRK